jgi:zinc/manganese transport system permease protein
LFAVSLSRWKKDGERRRVKSAVLAVVVLFHLKDMIMSCATLWLSLASLPALSWNLFADAQTLLSYPFMQNAFLAGSVVAVVAGVVGYFVVLRSLSFATHALSHIGFAGATGALVLALSPVYGMLALTLGSSTLIGLLGKRLYGRDVVIGTVLAWTLGLGVLFLSLYVGYATEAYSILFGQILGIGRQDVQLALWAGGATLLAMALIYRPLLFASLDEEIAEAKGVPVHLLSVLFMMIVGFAVAAAAQVMGVLLIFALLVTPAAVAERLTTRPPLAIALSVLFSLLFTWGGLAVAFYTPYPVSFFITSFAFGTYVVVRAVPMPGFLATRLRKRLVHHAVGTDQIALVTFPKQEMR